MSELQGKFYLERFPAAYPNGNPDNKCVVALNGRGVTVYCASKVRPEKEALAHFWRWIGAE